MKKLVNPIGTAYTCLCEVRNEYLGQKFNPSLVLIGI